MGSFQILTLIVAVSLIPKSWALRCYRCDYEEGQFGRPADCENNPSQNYLVPVLAHPPTHGVPQPPPIPFRPDMKFSARYVQMQRGQQTGGGNMIWFPYCVTIRGTRNGRKVVYRDMAWADSPQNDGHCEGQLPQNYESISLENPEACYCNSDDGCNGGATSDMSDLQCFDCFWYELVGFLPGSSEECRHYPSGELLTPVPNQPAMKLRSSYELAKILTPKGLDLYQKMLPSESRRSGRQENWVPYCATLTALVDGKRMIIRGVHWWEDGTKNGLCESDFPSNLNFRDVVGFGREKYTDVRMCYCNSQNGCNNSPDGRGNGGGTSISIAALVLAVSSLLYFIAKL